MPCYYPLDSYRTPEGRITFDPRESEENPVKVPCSQCVGCRIEHSRQWATRLMHETKSHSANSFLTLTLAKENYPEDGSLDTRLWQLFAKRLRAQMRREDDNRLSHLPRNTRKYRKLRFLHCGEYGEENGRAHYHAWVNLDWKADRKFWKKSKSSGEPLYRSASLEKLWGVGLVAIGTMTHASAQYLAGYIIKKQNGDRAKKAYGTKKAPYITMSRNPGIGNAWIKRWIDDVYPSDQVIINGKITRPPKYYDEYLKSVDLEMYWAIKHRRETEGMSFEENNTEARLRVRETLAKQKINRFKREY